MLTIGLLIASLGGPIAKDRRVRRAALLFAATGWLLPLVADAAASVDPRFILPAYGPLGASAALGLSGGGFRRRLSRRPRHCPGRLPQVPGAPTQAPHR